MVKEFVKENKKEIIIGAGIGVVIGGALYFGWRTGIKDTVTALFQCLKVLEAGAIDASQVGAYGLAVNVNDGGFRILYGKDEIEKLLKQLPPTDLQIGYGR